MAIDGLRVLIVDDDSPDGTGDEARRAGRGQRRPRLGDAPARSARASAARTSTAWRRRFAPTPRTSVRWTPTSRTIRPRCRGLLAATAGADLVIGSRYVPGGAAANWPAHRVMLSTFANWYVRAITRLPVHDCTSGFRCWTRDLLARLPLDRIVSDGYAFLVEMAWEAHAAGGRIVEVPITFVERREGQSKMSGRVIAESVAPAVATGGAAAPCTK